jgi:hypothetical protein
MFDLYHCVIVLMRGIIASAFVRNPPTLYFYVIHYICTCSGCGRVHRACTLFYFIDLVLNSRTFRFYCSLLPFFCLRLHQH